MLPRWSPVVLFAVLACGCSWCPLVFSPKQLEPATVGEAYRFPILIHSNKTPVGSIHLKSGHLPPGLKLRFVKDDQLAFIEGTPTTAGTYEFVLGAWSYGTNFAGQQGQHRYRLVVKKE